MEERTAKSKMKDLERKKRYTRKHLKKMKKQHAIVPIPEDKVLDLLVESKEFLKARDNSNATVRHSFIKNYVKKVKVYEDIIKVIFNINEEVAG